MHIAVSNTGSRLAKTLTRPEFHTSIPEEDNSQNVVVHPAGPRRFHVVLFAGKWLHEISIELFSQQKIPQPENPQNPNANTSKT